LHSKNEVANYLSIKKQSFIYQTIDIAKAFKINPLGRDTYFAFEATYTPFQQYIIGALPRTDLVIQQKSTGQCLAGMEIKLTALPDNTTCHLAEKDYGSEIVVRPDTIVYLACSIAQNLSSQLGEFIKPEQEIEDWGNAHQVIPFIPTILQRLANLVKALESKQSPFLLQPIWKTKGKSSQLADHCLDVFFWSDAGFTYFITEIANLSLNTNRITRQMRSAIWLYKMLLDITINTRFNHKVIIDNLSYNTKNDKAFASSGNITNKYMRCERLTHPKITKYEIKEIILGGGQELLSPERRFDAIIVNSPELFS
jgi:type II restriction enzyme